MPPEDLQRLDEVARHSRRAGRRYEAVRAIARAEGPDADALLVALFEDPAAKGAVRAEALRGLADRGHPDRADHVVAGCADPDRQVRLFAVARVAHEAPDRARTALKAAQQDDSRLVRAIADRALAGLPPAT